MGGGEGCSRGGGGVGAQGTVLMDFFDLQGFQHSIPFGLVTFGLKTNLGSVFDIVEMFYVEFRV